MRIQIKASIVSPTLSDWAEAHSSNGQATVPLQMDRPPSSMEMKSGTTGPQGRRCGSGGMFDKSGSNGLTLVAQGSGESISQGICHGGTKVTSQGTRESSLEDVKG